jgi:hypothetical protein
MENLNEQRNRMLKLMNFDFNDNSADILSEENFNSIEVVKTHITEQDNIKIINGKRYKVNTTVADPHEGDNIEINFGAGKSDITDKSGLIQGLKDVKTWMDKNTDLTDENIIVTVNAGSSNYWGKTPKSTDEANNKTLTQKRANSGVKVVKEIAGDIFDKNQLSKIQFVADGETNANGGPYWGDEKAKGVSFEDFKKSAKQYQFVKVNAFASGEKTIKESLPDICNNGIDTAGGTRADESNGWKTYTENDGKGKLINFGKGIGKIKFTFDAKVVPDMFRIIYNGKEYYSQYKGNEGFISNYTRKILSARRGEGKDIFSQMKYTDRDATKVLIDSLMDISTMVDKKGDKIWSSLDKTYETKQGDKTFLEILGMANKLSDTEMNAFKDKFRGFFKEMEQSLNQYYKDDRGRQKTKRNKYGESISTNDAKKWLAEDGNRQKLYYLLKTFQKFDQTERNLKKIFGFLRFKRQQEFASDVRNLENLRTSINEPSKELSKLIIKYQQLMKQEEELDKTSSGGISRDDIENTVGVNPKLQMYASQLDNMDGDVPRIEVVGPTGSITIDKIEGVDEGYLQVWAPFGGTVWSYSIGCIGANGEKGGMSANVGSTSEEKEREKRAIEDFIDDGEVES